MRMSCFSLVCKNLSDRGIFESLVTAPLILGAPE